MNNKSILLSLPIKFITKEAEVWSGLEGIVENIWDLSSLFEDIKFQYVHRSGNKIADVIAKRVRVLEICNTWVVNFPEWLSSLVENDRCQIAQVA